MARMRIRYVCVACVWAAESVFLAVVHVFFSLPGIPFSFLLLFFPAMLCLPHRENGDGDRLSQIQSNEMFPLNKYVFMVSMSLFRYTFMDERIMYAITLLLLLEKHSSRRCRRRSRNRRCPWATESNARSGCFCFFRFSIRFLCVIDSARDSPIRTLTLVTTARQRNINLQKEKKRERAY